MAERPGVKRRIPEGTCPVCGRYARGEGAPNTGGELVGELLAANDVVRAFRIDASGRFEWNPQIDPGEAGRLFADAVSERLGAAGVEVQPGPVRPGDGDGRVRAFLRRMAEGDAWVNTPERAEAAALLEAMGERAAQPRGET